MASMGHQVMANVTDCCRTRRQNVPPRRARWRKGPQIRPGSWSCECTLVALARHGSLPDEEAGKRFATGTRSWPTYSAPSSSPPALSLPRISTPWELGHNARTARRSHVGPASRGNARAFRPHQAASDDDPPELTGGDTLRGARTTQSLTASACRQPSSPRTNTPSRSGGRADEFRGSGNLARFAFRCPVTGGDFDVMSVA